MDTRENTSDEVELRKRAALLDLANDAIFVTELDGTITYWNQGAERLYGWTPAEAIGKDEAQLLRAEFPLAQDELVKTLLIQGHWEGEVTRYRKSGEPLIVSSRWSLLRDSQGTPVARMVINTDLTATKLAFEELRRAEAEAKARASELAAILDAMPGATFIAHDPGCQSMTSSGGAYALLRLPQGAHTSKSAPESERPNTFRVMRYGREIAPERLPVQLAAATGQPVLDTEVTLVFEDGTSRDILGNAAPLFDGAGKVRGAVGAFIDITERNRALNLAKQQKAILEAVLDSTSDSVFLKDCDGRYLAINPAGARAAGKSPEECLGKDDYAIFPEAVAARYMQRDRDVLSSGRSMTFEDEMAVEGKWRQVQTVKNVCRDADGRLIGVVGVTRDISKQKSAALREMLFDSDLIGVGCGDKLGLMTEANDKFLELVGYTREDLHRGRVRWDGMTPPEYASIDTAGIAEAALKGSCTPYEKEFIRKDGSRIPILVGYRLEQPTGQLIGFVLDLSAQKLAESALREREKRFRALAESLPQLIWTADAKGEKTYCNQPYLEYTGVTSLAEMSSSWQEFVHADDREPTSEAWKDSVATGKPYLKEYRLRRKDGVFRHHLARAVPLRNELGETEQWLGSITDVHDQKTSEEVLRRTEKLAATGRLAASIAHEINNPLNAVTNVLFLALQDPNLADATRKYLKLAELQLARVANVTTQTLRFHKHSSRAAPADVCELMDSALSVIAPRLEECSVTVEREYNCAQKLYCYDSELRQVFANLLSNALDAIGRGGRIRIRIKLAHAWDGRETRGIRIILGDTGGGVPDNLKRQIFEPFVSTKEATSTGLGLWVTEGIVRTHHGRICLRSSTHPQKHGTVLSLFFPFVGVAE